MSNPEFRAPIPAIMAFIGGGNMARSLIGGLIARGQSPQTIQVAEPDAARRDQLHAEFGVAVTEDNVRAADAAETIVLAVKPQVMRAVCEGLAPSVAGRSPLVLSIAAGVRMDRIAQWLGRETPIVRAMPNTPALLGAGVSGLCANASASAAQRATAQALLEAVGKAIWIADEALMDAVTAVSGSGPAYVFLLAEAMQAAGIAQGLSADATRILVTQTLLGAARMLSESEEPSQELRRRVTSPGGTTEAAIRTFEAGGFKELVEAAIAAATRRGTELSRDS